MGGKSLSWRIRGSCPCSLQCVSEKSMQGGNYISMKELEKPAFQFQLSDQLGCLPLRGREGRGGEENRGGEVGGGEER